MAGGLEVGRVYARVGAELDDDGFVRFKRRLDEARRDVAKPIEAEGRVDVDEGRFRKLAGEMTRARQNARAAIKAEAKLDVDKRGFDEYQRRLRNAQADGERFRSKVSGAMKLAGAAVAGAAVAGAGAAGIMGKSFIDTASDVEESLTKNKVLFKGYADDVQRFADTTAKSFGISRRDALAYTGDLGNLFNATGVATDKSAEFSQKLIEQAANMASFNNANPTEVLDALKSGLTGEAEPLRRFGVLLNDARVKTEAVSSGIAKQGEELTEAQKVQARYNLILEDSAAANDDFQETSGGLANQIRILKARFTDAGEGLGRQLLPHVNRAVSGLNGMISEAEKGRGPLIALRDGAVTVGEGLQTLWGVVKRVGSAIGSLVGYFRDNRGAMDALLVSVAALAGGFLALKVLGLITGLITAARTAVLLFNLALRANPIGLIITLLAAFAAAFVVLYKRSETFRNAVDTAFGAIKRAIGSAVKFILGYFSTMLNAMADVLGAMSKIPGIGDKFKGLEGKVRGAANEIDRIRDGINKVPKNTTVNFTAKVRLNYSSNVGDSKDDYPGSTGAGLPLTLEERIESEAMAGAKKAGRKLAPTAPGGGYGPLGSKEVSGVDSFNDDAARFSLGISSGFRLGDDGFHGVNRARDYSNSTGPTPQMMAFAQYMRRTYGAKLRELFYSPMGGSIKDGRWVPGMIVGGALGTPGNHYNHVHVAYKHGGKGILGGPVGPSFGGARAFIAGEGSKDEWVISQEGDRTANVTWAKEALETLTGREVHLHRGGRGRSKTPKPILRGFSNAGVERSIARGDKGLSKYEKQIRDMEREYGQADRKFGLTEENVLIENDDGSVTVNAEAVGARHRELAKLYELRAKIRAKIEEYREAVVNLMNRLSAERQNVKDALGEAKGKARAKERGRYRAAITDYTARIGELSEVRDDLGGDLVDADLDLRELTNEQIALGNTAPTPAPRTQGAEPTETDTDNNPPPPSPGESPQVDVGAALAALRENLASTYQSYGSNFERASSFGGAPTSPGIRTARYFGAGGMEASPFNAVAASGGIGGAGTTIVNNFAAPPPDAHVWAAEQAFTLEAAP